VGDGAQLTALAGANITANSIPSTALIAAVREALCPPGTVVAYMGTTAPAGWLLCNGASVSRTTYASLYAVIGNASGSADTNSFNVPDFRGRFLRGWDNNTGRDPDRASRTAMATGGNINDAIGSIQGDQLKSHNHYIARTVVDLNADGGIDHRSGAATTDDGHWAGQNTEFTGGNETRPINAYVNYIIKF
jgi:microcystin-dependent protein